MFFCEFIEDWWLESPDLKAFIPSGTEGELRLPPPAVSGQIITYFYVSNQHLQWLREGRRGVFGGGVGGERGFF